MIKRLMTNYVPGMLTCEEVDRFLYDFHQENLPYSKKLKFKLHLSLCKECKAYVHGYKNTIRRSKTDFITAKPIEKIPEKLIQAILKSRHKN